MKTIKKRQYAKSSSFFMALLFTILCGASAICLGYFINYFAKGHFVHSTESVLDTEIRYIETLQNPEILPQNPGRIYHYLEEGSALPDILPSPEKRLAEGILVFAFQDTGQRYAAKIHTQDDGRKILIGTDITEISEDFRFMQWLGIASICFVVIVVFAAYVISVFVVSGTNNIATIAYEIIRTGDLSRRVVINSRWDDLSNMAAVLNMLLARIETLMEGVRQVSDNIAHDLRTPLTRMKSHIDELKKKSPENKAYQQLSDEADHILNSFNALLRISRIETEQRRSQFSNIDLHALLGDVGAFYEPLAEEHGIRLNLELEEVAYFGDRDLLFQAFANLLDNALKFTPTGGSIKLSLKRHLDEIWVVVQDSGPGVAEHEKDKIFERFYRGERSRTSSGIGLGLSLVSAVIGLHGGRIAVENTNPGFKIITIL